MSRIKEYAIKCLRDEAQAILNLIPLLDDNFDKAVELIHHCKGRLIVTGVGKSGHIGAKIAATLASTVTPSFFVNPLDAFHGESLHRAESQSCGKKKKFHVSHNIVHI